MENNKLYDESLQRAADYVRRGGVILYPTDTVWGIGCDATNSEAVKRVYDIKHRADHKAMIVLLDNQDLLDRYVEVVPDIALELLDVAVKPTTIVYDQGVGLAPELLAPDGSVGIRVTSEPFSRELCRRCRKPLVSTSANVSGQPTPACFNEISKEIIEAVDYVVETRRDEEAAAVPSSVIRLGNHGEVKILRP